MGLQQFLSNFPREKTDEGKSEGNATLPEHENVKQ